MIKPTQVAWLSKKPVLHRHESVTKTLPIGHDTQEFVLFDAKQVAHVEEQALDK